MQPESQKGGKTISNNDQEAFSTSNVIFEILRANESKAYTLIVGNQAINVYCHMTMASTGNGACRDGGWTLVIKNDGQKVLRVTCK